MRTRLVIAYQPTGAIKALELISVDDEVLLRAAAQHAIAEKQDQAARLAKADRGLGIVAKQEADRVSSVLHALVPGLSS